MEFTRGKRKGLGSEALRQRLQVPQIQNTPEIFWTDGNGRSKFDTQARISVILPQVAPPAPFLPSIFVRNYKSESNALLFSSAYLSLPRRRLRQLQPHLQALITPQIWLRFSFLPPRSSRLPPSARLAPGPPRLPLAGLCHPN